MNLFLFSIFRTMYLVLMQGFGLSLNSSAWLDLTEMVSSNQKSMAYVITSSFVGVSVGALSGKVIS